MGSDVNKLKKKDISKNSGASLSLQRILLFSNANTAELVNAFGYWFVFWDVLPVIACPVFKILW